MNYKITITRLEPNPEWEEKLNRIYGYGQTERIPEKYMELQVTNATLSEEQWSKVQKAIVEAL